MRKILVATDGSEHAERAVALAGELAARHEAPLVILHVISDQPLSADERHLAEIEFADEIHKYPDSGLPTVVTGMAPGAPQMRAVVTEHEKTNHALRSMIGETVLRRAEQDARGKGAREVDTLLKDGGVAKQILETAKAQGADMIVLGCRGLGTVEELFLGSVSHKVAHLSEATVVTVR